MNEEEKAEYHILIIKLLADEISDNEIIQLKSWLEKDPDNRRLFNEENEIWQDLSIHTKFADYNPDKAWMKISSRLGLGGKKLNSPKILTNGSFWILIAAATIACLVAIGSLSLWITGKTSLQKSNAYPTLVMTNEGDKAHIFLADSTEVILNSGSSIKYDGNYNLKDRIVQLKGEAFFDVTTNPLKPFTVKLDKMIITAKGTRFNVFSFGNEDRIETTLEEGIICISIKGEVPVNLKSGQQLVYFQKSGKVLVHEVSTDTYTSWKENKLYFNDTPFEEVLRRIGRKYNVIFEITNSDLLNLKYTATFIDESIEEVMQMLKAVSPITYEIYNRTSVNDKQYLKPKIVIGKRKHI